MRRRPFTTLPAVSVLLLTVTSCVGCKRDTTAADTAAARVRAHENTSSYLDQAIAAIRRGDDTASYKEYHLPGYEGARAWLATVPPATRVHPRPVLAILQRRDGWQAAKLTLLWLESGFEAHGLRLADESGDVAVLDHLSPYPPYSPAEIVERSSTLRRTQTLDVAETKSSLHGPGVVRVPRPLTSPRLQLILRYGAGSESQPVAVYLDDMRGAPKAGAPATTSASDPS